MTKRFPNISPMLGGLGSTARNISVATTAGAQLHGLHESSGGPEAGRAAVTTVPIYRIDDLFAPAGRASGLGWPIWTSKAPSSTCCAAPRTLSARTDPSLSSSSLFTRMPPTRGSCWGSSVGSASTRMSSRSSAVGRAATAAVSSACRARPRLAARLAVARPARRVSAPLRGRRALDLRPRVRPVLPAGDGVREGMPLPVRGDLPSANVPGLQHVVARRTARPANARRQRVGDAEHAHVRLG